MIYIFCGTDYSTIKQKYDLLLETQKLRVRQFETVADMVTHIYQKSLISQNIAFCVRYDEDFLKAENSWAEILKASKDSIVILFYKALDKRSKFYKFFEDYIIEFNENEENLTFVFADELCKKNFKKALEIYENIPATESLSLLGIIYSKIRNILQVQATPQNIKISVNTGLKDNVIFFTKKLVGLFTDEELEYLLQYICYLTEEIKSGKIELENSIPLLIFSMYSLS